MTVNPFDADTAMLCVLVNDEEQHSLWPSSVDVPHGWRVVFGPDIRANSLRYVDENWIDLRPRSLRERMAERQLVDVDDSYVRHHHGRASHE